MLKKPIALAIFIYIFKMIYSAIIALRYYLSAKSGIFAILSYWEFFISSALIGKIYINKYNEILTKKLMLKTSIYVGLFLGSFELIKSLYSHSNLELLLLRCTLIPIIGATSVYLTLYLINSFKLKKENEPQPAIGINIWYCLLLTLNSQIQLPDNPIFSIIFISCVLGFICCYEIIPGRKDKKQDSSTVLDSFCKINDE